MERGENEGNEHSKFTSKWLTVRKAIAEFPESGGGSREPGREGVKFHRPGWIKRGL